MGAMQGEDSWLGDRSWLAQEMEKEKQKRMSSENRTKSEKGRELPARWVEEMYRGDEKYDWAEVGPLPRGGKGKINNNKRKRSEREGDEMSKRRGWVYYKEYVKIDSSTGLQPIVTKMPMFESC